MNWSIVVFCYNERDNIAKAIENINAFLLKADIENFEVLIINDGSSDGTREVLEKIVSLNSNLKLINHEKNLGIGRALRTGYNLASKEYVCAIPGDNQFDIDELLKVKPFSLDTFYSFYRTNLYKSSYRKLIHILNKLFNKWFLNMQIKDVNWIKVYRKDQLKKVDFQLESSIIESEICAKLFKLGAKPIELPSKYLPRDYGNPKGGTWKTVSMAIKETWSLFWVVYKFKA